MLSTVHTSNRALYFFSSPNSLKLSDFRVYGIGCEKSPGTNGIFCPSDINTRFAREGAQFGWVQMKCAEKLRVVRFPIWLREGLSVEDCIRAERRASLTEERAGKRKGYRSPPAASLSPGGGRSGMFY